MIITNCGAGDVRVMADSRRMADDDSDNVLLERLRRGDEGAFEKIFMRHYAMVYRVLYGLTGVREAAEDGAQETFLTLYRRPPAPEQPLRPWLCRVALNTTRNALRSERRDAARIARVALRSDADDPDPAETVERAEVQDQVRAALAMLPRRQAHLLLLRHAGLSYAEVAAVLDIAPGSVGTLLARAERAFAEAYARYTSARPEEPSLGKQVQP